MKALLKYSPVRIIFIFFVVFYKFHFIIFSFLFPSLTQASVIYINIANKRSSVVPRLVL